MYAYHNREEAYPQSLTLPRPMRVAPPHARPASTPSASGLRLVCLDRSAENILILAIQHIFRCLQFPNNSNDSLFRHHRSFNHPRRVPASYGFASLEGTPWRSKHEFFPGDAAAVVAASSSSVRRQHSARRVISAPVVAGGFHVHMDPSVSAACAGSFGQRYTTRRAVMPPPPTPTSVVFERSRDDYGLEKSGPLRDMQQLRPPFSFASAVRSEGAPSSLLKESLIRGASSASAGPGLARSHSQLHRSVDAFSL